MPIVQPMRQAAPNLVRMRRMLMAVQAAGMGDLSVLEAMARVPRELFLPRALEAEAYDDVALPIGEQQTISMPTVVAKMTAALKLTGKEKVLEIGTGCGYQTAVLSKLCRRVFSIERHARLSEGAVARLTAMGVNNFTAIVGDGSMGWPAQVANQAPFDAIIVTAAGPKIPPALLAQLKPGGVLVLPVGELESMAREAHQRLVRVTRSLDGASFQEEMLGLVSFVPLVGEQGVALRRAS